jgi:hypothetical protein
VIHILGQIFLIASSTQLSATDITSEFANGNSSTAVDGYSGTSGLGWLNGWKATASNSYYANSVLSTAPLTGGGNYLSTTLTYNGTATLGWGAIGRKFDPVEVNPSAPHTIRFKVRPERVAQWQ